MIDPRMDPKASPASWGDAFRVSAGVRAAAARAASSSAVGRGRVLGAPSRTVVGRQPIVTPGGGVRAYEFLYRSADGAPTRVDTWSAAGQDRATGTVLAAVRRSVLPAVVGTADAFVNVT